MNSLPTIEPNHQAIAFLIVIACAGVVAIIVLLGRYFNLWQQAKRLSSFKFSSKKFRELANIAELNEEERNFLEDYFHNNQTPRCLDIFFDHPFGQNMMRQIYRATYTHAKDFTCDIDLARYYVFSINQKLQNSLHKSVFPSSTKKILKGSRCYLHIFMNADDEKPTRFVGKLRTKRRKGFECQLLNGNPSSIPRGSEVKMELIKDGDRGIYTSRVRGYTRYKSKHKQWYKLLMLQHSKKPHIIFGARRYNRKPLQASAAVLPMRQEGNKYKADGATINALLCDVSITGCGVLSYIKFPVNTFISISYLNPYDNQTINLICEIVGHAALRNDNIDAIILQNRIVQIDYRDRNLIAAFVYDFESENDKIKKIAQRKKEQQASNFDSKTVAVLSGRS